MCSEEAAVCGHEVTLLPVLLPVVPPAAGSRVTAVAGPPAGPHGDGPPAEPRSVLTWGSGVRMVEVLCFMFSSCISSSSFMLRLVTSPLHDVEICFMSYS